MLDFDSLPVEIDETDEIKSYWYDDTPVVTILKKSNKVLLTTDKKQTEHIREIMNTILKEYNIDINKNWEVVSEEKKAYSDGMVI